MSLQQGTTLWYATAGTSWTLLAAGAAPASPWVQVTRVNNIKVTPHEVERYDTAPLEATAKAPARDLQPGNITFQVEQLDPQSGTLRGFADAGTKKAYAVVYRDGTADYTASGALVVPTGSEANKGDFHARIPESYQVDSDTTISRQAHA
jgi:hypothetical protein